MSVSNGAPIATLFSMEDVQEATPQPPPSSATHQQAPRSSAPAPPAATQATVKFHIPNVFDEFTPADAALIEQQHQQQQQQQAAQSGESSIEFELARPSPKQLLNGLQSSKKAAVSSSSSPQPAPSASQCGHTNTGQELCYLCHQRQRRNVPVYLHEETRMKELEEQQLLNQYQDMKETELRIKDENKRNEQRMDRAKMDAFNIGVMEAVKAKKHERPKTSDLSVIIKHISQNFDMLIKYILTVIKAKFNFSSEYKMYQYHI